MTPNLQTLRFPIGKFQRPKNPTEIQIRQWIGDIERFPELISEITKDLSNEQKNQRYRPGGWTIKQVVHHCADSHINSMIRYKLALTEDSPTIKGYYEDRWAELPDSLDDDLSDTISLITALHSRWTKLLKSLTTAQFKRDFIHPESGRKTTLEENTALYAWHCNHHLAHIRQALDANGKY